MDHPASRLDDLVHQKTRLGVLAVLGEAESVEFRFLQETLGVTAGNLSRHLSVLAGAGLIEVNKGFSGQRPRTWISLTSAGHAALVHEITALKSLVALVESDVTDNRYGRGPGHHQ